jgi:ubiquitin-like-conjugating enzyme ATG3
MSGWQWKKAPSSIAFSVDPPEPSKHFLESYALSSQRCSAISTAKNSIDQHGFVVVEETQQQPTSPGEDCVYNYTITITYDRKYHCNHILSLQVLACGFKESSRIQANL